MSPELGNSYSDVMAAQDVALYGGLCALASFDRSEIKRNVVESISFRETLELNPEVGSQPCQPITSLLAWNYILLIFIDLGLGEAASTGIFNAASPCDV